MPSISTTVAAPPQAVFDYLTDPRRRPEWQASLHSVQVLDHGPVRLHMRWIDHTVVGARPRLQIVELRAPDDARAGTWREVGRWHGIRAELALTFETDPRGTRVSGTVEIGGWRLASLVLQALAPAAIASDLRRAGRILEAH
ncbi:SRPBCC family protein [Nocardioides sp. CER19]|uniref:SRPBCC family protein n=1 Tax=Nocardioides sp. CER19 TaxID=3038538 RepID=UPI00244A5DB0|nr:SRPBCC family protein [Nocardioides sp. CER19]MDH2414605.1 SRPBCC family protein [Nocardioides sp. CER19]